jgi:hypothetical protein
MVIQFECDQNFDHHYNFIGRVVHRVDELAPSSTSFKFERDFIRDMETHQKLKEHLIKEWRTKSLSFYFSWYVLYFGFKNLVI